MNDDCRPFFTCVQTKGQTFVFIWTPENRDSILRQLGRYASDPDMPFTWYDAAKVGAEINRQVAET